jgi:lysozyme
MKRVTGAAGLAMVKGREGLRLFAYPDPDSDLAQATPHLRKRWGFENAVTLLATLPAETQKLSGAPWTIGYGHTGDVEPGQQITEHQADVVLASDLGWAEDCINLRAPNIGQNQFDALVDLVINIGCPAFDTSTLLRLVRKGDFNAVAGDPAQNFKNGQFIRFNHDNGKVVPALTARRIAEAKLFLTPDPPPDFSNVEAGVESTAPKEPT